MLKKAYNSRYPLALALLVWFSCCTSRPQTLQLFVAARRQHLVQDAGHSIASSSTNVFSTAAHHAFLPLLLTFMPSCGFFRRSGPPTKPSAAAFDIRLIMAGAAVTVRKLSIGSASCDQLNPLYSVLFVDSRFGADDRQVLDPHTAPAFMCLCHSLHSACATFRSGSEAK